MTVRGTTRAAEQAYEGGGGLAPPEDGTHRDTYSWLNMELLGGTNEHFRKYYVGDFRVSATILEGEEEHVETLETHLGLLAKIGLENYIQLQSGPAS